MPTSQAIACYLCGHPVDQKLLRKLCKEDGSEILKGMPFRLCAGCYVAMRDGRITENEVTRQLIASKVYGGDEDA